MKKRLRKISKNDSEMIFDWRNHPMTRANSFNKSVLSLAKHKLWFNNILNSNKIRTYILEIDNISVGAIRFEIESIGNAKINYLIDPSKQGNGFGTEILKLGVVEIFTEMPDLRKVYGYVLKKNFASIRIFEKLSFKKVSENDTEIKFEKS